MASRKLAKRVRRAAEIVLTCDILEESQPGRRNIRLGTSGEYRAEGWGQDDEENLAES